jgi:hypothetical protein
MTQWGLPIVAAENVNVRPLGLEGSPRTSRAGPRPGSSAVEAHGAHGDRDQGAAVPDLGLTTPPGVSIVNDGAFARPWSQR